VESAVRNSAEADRPYHHGDLRAALLDAAETVLRREGLEGLSLRAVAREAGVSHTASAHHFGDMKGVFTALAIKAFKELERRCEDAANAGGLSALCHAYVDMARASPALFLLMFQNERVNPNARAFAAAGARAYAVLQSHLARARRKAGAAESGDAAAALMAWTMIHGYAVLEINKRLRVAEKRPKIPNARDLFRPMIERALHSALM
jgi:AcrR family transcriptional regulator